MRMYVLVNKDSVCLYVLVNKDCVCKEDINDCLDRKEAECAWLYLCQC